MRVSAYQLILVTLATGSICAFLRVSGLFGPHGMAVGLPSSLQATGKKLPTYKTLRQLHSSETDVAVIGDEIWWKLQNASKIFRTARQAAEFLLEVAARRNATPGVVQVGACDGEWTDTNDPVQPLLSDLRVRAILLEPVPATWEELYHRVKALPEAEGRLLAVNSALCPKGREKKRKFYVVSEQYAIDNPEAPHWARREIGSLNRSHLEAHRIPAKYIEEINVPCKTPAQLFSSFSPVVGLYDVDVLLVDAEGFDAEVVGMFLDEPDFRATLIMFERQHMGKTVHARLMESLKARGYQSWTDRRNTVAVLTKRKA